jgi:hypothetical protein
MASENYLKCREQAFILIQSITKETKEEQERRYYHDATYYGVISHITNLYYYIRESENTTEVEMQYLEAIKNLVPNSFGSIENLNLN